LGLKLDEPGGIEQYQQEEKIDLCRKIAETVTIVVREQLQVSRGEGAKLRSPESC
jgi:hypothetical protein